MVMINSVPSQGMGNSVSRFSLLPITLLVCAATVSVCSGQIAVSTGRADNQRTGQNVNETLLTPANVNSNQFGALFNYPIDYQALAQPLYVPNVNIPGQGTHNVVYVATMADSVYAFDADSNVGSNASPLWWVNFTNPAIYGDGIVLANGTEGTLPCAGTGAGTVGFYQEGIAGTPVIDTVGGTLYVVAKTVENGTVRHRLHALDITTGEEKFGGPVLISATTSYTSPITGNTYNTTFNSLHQLNRPGLLLLNGVVYMAFGSNSCNDDNHGWVLSYDASNLAPIASFNTSPEHGLVSIWQTGNGIAADEFNNIFVETAESCYPCYDIPEGGATYSNSVVELDPNSLTVTDYFTPWDVAFLNQHDEDLSSTGVLILPDQAGATPHELVAGGKEGFVYVLNRDDMGNYNSTTDQILQEFALVPDDQPEQAKDVLFSSPAYWNNTVYFTPDASPILAYPLSSGSPPLGTPVATAQKYVGAHSPSVSANGTTNGILWALSGSNLDAFNATTMQLLYSSDQVKARDTLPPVAHFVTQTVANGKVYVATQTTLSAYGLLPNPALVGGGNQSATVLTTLPAAIQVQIVNPYGGAGIAGVTVSFSDGGKKGTFNPASAVSDSNGNVSTSYTFSKTAGVVTITASASGGTRIAFTETALPGPAKGVAVASGSGQSGQTGSILPMPLKARVVDAYSNGVAGITVAFVDKSGAGTLNPTSGVSNATGFVLASYQLPNTAGTYKIVGSATGLSEKAQFTEYATGDAPANVDVVSGNN